MSCFKLAGRLCTCKTYNGCDNLTCNDGYYQILHHNSRQQLCQGGLSADETIIVCYKCKAGTLIVGISVQNNNCQTFDVNTGICTKLSN
ncbi:unnamed protein product (macronuclear) [Paramecium tetraurelia]|uniref:EGF-like domain-containing protein n=1 Tax=Paramecium tetraurelia TaxID=5888 RepID=A0C393_PARTE|nr:uncharacterized protein GSPATT00034738001 [Paramecium tetraurelia]CAK65260.1 unnamed protein product [Paramecium tetraurelia]|eukprot:XP_001432657.1 hypothetical protein (macronuclear) [Paramecium tetraurelia strain d4-2]